MPLRRLAFLLLAVLCLASVADARPRRKLTVRFPRFTLPAGASRELCYLVFLPRTTPVDVASWEVKHKAAPGMSLFHFLVYAYSGEDGAGWQAAAKRIAESRGCLAVGPADRDRRQLVMTAPGLKSRLAYPDGVALRLAPVPEAPGGSPAGVALLLDANWVNGSTRPRAASSRVVLRVPRRGTVRRLATPFTARTPELGLAVAPASVRKTEDSTTALHALRPEVPAVDVWRPSADACTMLVSAQMHERGIFLAVDHLGSDGQPRNPLDGPTNPFEPGRRHLFAAADYTDPGSLGAAPRLVRADEALHPVCWHDNGSATSLRLGCEESSGVAPGVAAGLDGAPAKPCTIIRTASPECPTTDAAYPGRTFTGACVPANLVAGTTPDDEVCGVTGVAYDAVAGADEASACDVSGLPPLP